MIPTGTVLPISFYCPFMKVSTISFNLHQTEEEKMIASIKMPDSSNLIIENVIIPPTYVRRQKILKWIVDSCTGEGKDISGNSISITLEPELVIWSWTDFTMVAQPVNAKGILTLSNGQIGTINCIFPSCKTSLLTSTAASVTAIGTVSF